MENKQKIAWYKRPYFLWGIILGLTISIGLNKHDHKVDNYGNMYKIEAIKMAYISHVSYLQLQRGYCYQAALELSNMLGDSPAVQKKKLKNKKFLELIEKIDH